MGNRERAPNVLRECQKKDQPTAHMAERLETAGLITPDTTPPKEEGNSNGPNPFPRSA